VIKERFAPSPTGLLHLGHAFSALTAFDAAKTAGGQFHLRIEDIDTPRCTPEFETAIYQDLTWLGMSWEAKVLHQSTRLGAYQDAMAALASHGLLYPCRCTRRDIDLALSAPQEGAPTHGPHGALYPGTCRHRRLEDITADDAIRLNMERAVAYLGGEEALNALGFTEIGMDPGTYRLSPAVAFREIGDIVLARRDIGTSYHIAVVVDDAHCGITHVTRGQDLFRASFIHRLLQALLNLPTPVYRHHRLIRDRAGKRLAKRDDARSIRAYRQAGLTPNGVRALIDL